MDEINSEKPPAKKAKMAKNTTMKATAQVMTFHENVNLKKIAFVVYISGSKDHPRRQEAGRYQTRDEGAEAEREAT